MQFDGVLRELALLREERSRVTPNTGRAIVAVLGGCVMKDRCRLKILGVAFRR